MKILIMTDNPGIPTGMGRVGRELALGLLNRGYKVSYLGWFSASWVDDSFPFKIHRTHNNYYGSDVFDNVVMEDQPDVVLTIGDAWMIRHIADVSKMRQFFKWVGYIPIDGNAWDGGIPTTWHTVIKNMDYPVAYTQYGKRKILHSLPELRADIKVIPHGVDTSIYHPLPKEEIEEHKRRMGIPEGAFIYLMVCRNQGRKNIPEFCKAWKKFKLQKGHEKCYFWPHMVFNDPMGWKLDEVFTIYNMWDDLIYMQRMAEAGNNITLIPEKQLNVIYNMCDVHVLISGEGFGLPTIEAMACGKPCINLDHSANTEIVTGRGELVRVAHYVTGHHSTERPYPDESSLIDALNKLYADEELRGKYGQEALKFAQETTWDSVVDKWDELLKEVENPTINLKFRKV